MSFKDEIRHMRSLYRTPRQPMIPDLILLMDRRHQLYADPLTALAEAVDKAGDVHLRLVVLEETVTQLQQQVEQLQREASQR